MFGTVMSRPATTIRAGLVALAIGGLIPFSATAQQAPAEHVEARQVIETLNAALLKVMQEAQTLGYAGRYETLSPVLQQTYDLSAMAKASLGGNAGHWQALNESQRSAMVDAFGRMSISTYAGRFDGYSGQRFEVTGSKAGPRGTVLVLSHIANPSGSAVKLNYLMRKRDDGWKIIDVFAKGSISEIATKRSDYGAVFSREGFDALIAALEAKIAAFEKS